MLAVAPTRADTPLTMEHVHGLSYSADGKQLIVASHNGLVVYADGRWSKSEGPAHDYMGLSATRDALYSSGHPAPTPELTDPMGVIKSSDGGKTWLPLGLAGESDFHTLATSYATHAIYVANREANSRMSRPGIFYTLNDGLAWHRAADKGRGYLLHSLAVHPTDAAMVAAATDVGLYLSRNFADKFDPLVRGKMVITAAFAADGQSLWFSTYDGNAGLSKIALKPGAKLEDVPLPGLTEDAVAYIAQNPTQPTEIAVATFKRNLLLSKDMGRTWTQIAKDGASRE